MNFTFQLTDQERQDIARALGHLIRALTNGTLKDSAPDSRQGQLPMPEAASVRGGRAAATALLAPPSVTEQMPPRDRWSKTNGTKLLSPENTDAYTVRIWKCEHKHDYGTNFLDVAWGSTTGSQPRHARCYAQELFPWIVKASKTREQIILYLDRDPGFFPKIVGVKA